MSRKLVSASALPPDDSLVKRTAISRRLAPVAVLVPVPFFCIRLKNMRTACVQPMSPCSWVRILQNSGRNSRGSLSSSLSLRPRRRLSADFLRRIGSGKSTGSGVRNEPNGEPFVDCVLSEALGGLGAATITAAGPRMSLGELLATNLRRCWRELVLAGPTDARQLTRREECRCSPDGRARQLWPAAWKCCLHFARRARCHTPRQGRCWRTTSSRCSYSVVEIRGEREGGR